MSTSSTRLSDTNESGNRPDSANTNAAHATPQTIGTRNLSATNSAPVSRPSSPPETIIWSACARTAANCRPPTRRRRFGTNGSNRRMTSGSRRSVLRPSASVTYVISRATEAAYAAKPAAHSAQHAIMPVSTTFMPFFLGEDFTKMPLACEAHI